MNRHYLEVVRNEYVMARTDVLVRWDKTANEFVRLTVDKYGDPCREEITPSETRPESSLHQRAQVRRRASNG